MHPDSTEGFHSESRSDGTWINKFGRRQECEGGLVDLPGIDRSGETFLANILSEPLKAPCELP